MTSQADQYFDQAESEEIDQRYEQAVEIIGFGFKNPDLLRLSLVHRSYLNEMNLEQIEAVHQSNERLEFLGDSVLGMITAAFLYERFPDLPEGELTAYRTALVRTETLADWARRCGFDQLLYLGRGELTADGEIRDRILAGAFEAILAAIYLDQGLDAVQEFIHGLLEEDSEEIISAGQVTNYKGRLQELVQDRYRVTPIYETIDVEGPAHERTFTVEVLIEDDHWGRGVGSSKRTAQQEAARQALAAIELKLAAEAEAEGTASDDGRTV